LNPAYRSRYSSSTRVSQSAGTRFGDVAKPPVPQPLRLNGLAAVHSLARLYAAARLHGNLFQPSFKLKEKRRIGARVTKRYHPPEPPLARVLAHAAVGGTR
jgi:hypothetical protein